jgi:hypothetical protein
MQAWDALVERYAPLIWSICRRYQLGDADSDDLGQAVWLQLMGHLGKICGPLHWPAGHHPPGMRTCPARGTETAGCRERVGRRDHPRLPPASATAPRPRPPIRPARQAPTAGYLPRVARRKADRRSPHAADLTHMRVEGVVYPNTYASSTMFIRGLADLDRALEALRRSVAVHPGRVLPICGGCAPREPACIGSRKITS